MHSLKKGELLEAVHKDDVKKVRLCLSKLNSEELNTEVMNEILMEATLEEAFKTVEFLLH